MQHPPRRATGFSLIEVMVVLVIVGIATAAISLSAAPDPAEPLRRDARELALRLEAAQHEVRIDGRVIAWESRGDGYRFVRGRWVNRPGSVVPAVSTAGELDAFEGDEALHPRRWHAPAVEVTPPGPVLLTSEWIGAPLALQLRSGPNRMQVLREADGGFAVR